MTLDLRTYLASKPGRCLFGFDHKTQHPGLCRCNEAPTGRVTPEEWAAFVRAIKASTRPDGTVSQTDMRPLIQDIFHKHRGPCYVHARTVGLLSLAGKEPSSDRAGGNGDKEQRVYRLGRAA